MPVRSRDGRAWSASLALLAGCTPVICRHPPTPPPPLVEVCQAVNANTARAPTLRASHMEMTVSGHGRRHTVDGLLAVGGPRQFHLTAVHSVLNEVLDCGSNAQGIWIWTYFPEATRHQVHVCRHEDLQARADLGADIPFRPDVIRDGLGLTLFPEPPADQYLEVQAQTLVVVTLRRFGGLLVPVKKTVLNRCNLYVIRQEVFRPTGELIAVADLEGHFVHQPSGAVLPAQVTIQWPAAGWTVRLRLGPVEVGLPLSEAYWEPGVTDKEEVDLGRR